MRLTSVVFPLPKNPVSMVTGTIPSCAPNSISWPIRRRATLFEHIAPQKFSRRPPEKRAHYSTLRITTQPPASGLSGRQELVLFQQQTLQVLALGKLDSDRMVGGGTIPLPQEQGRTRVRRGARNDLLKQIHRDTSGAREGREQS